MNTNFIENKREGFDGRTQKDENDFLGASCLAVADIGVGAGEILIGLAIGGPVGAVIGGLVWVAENGVLAYLALRNTS